MKQSRWPFQSSQSRGFSLIELIVVVAIFITLTSVILFNQNRFSSNSSIQNLAYQIAITVRQAQVYGLSVRGSQDNNNAIFDTAFGIHFDCSKPNQFILFADGNDISSKDGKYTVGNGSTDIARSTYTLDSGNLISDITTTGGQPFSCKNIVGSVSADITFRRPNPEAIILDNINGVSPLSKIEIDVVSALKDLHKKITVTQTGQIYVN